MVAVVAAACLVLGACGRRSHAGGAADKTASAGAIDTLEGALSDLTPGATAAGGGTPDVGQRAACPTTQPHASGNEDGTLVSGGLKRTYILHVPPSYDGTRQTPLRRKRRSASLAFSKRSVTGSRLLRVQSFMVFQVLFAELFRLHL